MQAFRYQPEKIVIGRLYHYEKSNIDGSHRHDIALYVTSTDQIEAYKWHSGAHEGLLIVAKIDWATFSASELTSWRLNNRDERTLGGTTLFTRRKQADGTSQLLLSSDPDFDQIEQTLSIGPYPWHSYDFDLASLNFTFRHLVDLVQPFTVGIVDPDWKAFERNEMTILYKGHVDVTYLADEVREQIACRKYRIDGPGLEQRGGLIWASQTGEYFVDYEIDLPDEPGFDSGKLRLKNVQILGPDAWQAFIKSQLN
jgi:hypothetical protein